ncbi:MAG: EVE domain-containing protein [Proteobacteria bacterium]|nr:EVE domain-containing protein [Pseudomonadota bacterium]
MARRFWLMKTEPDVFSWDDLERSADRTTPWDGVRNYQARNFMRDDMQIGDGVLFYHSRQDPMAIVGIARVAKAAYPDPSQFDPESKYFDPKSPSESPRWFCVAVQAVRRLDEPVTLARLREAPALAEMQLLRKGQRLSVQPVTASEWKAVLRLAGVNAREV